MTGPGVEIHRATAIILGSLILIAHNHRNRRAEGISAFGAGLNLDSVLFIAGCGESALAGTASGHLRLDVSFGEGHAWRAAIDDAADRAAVGFAVAWSVSCFQIVVVGVGLTSSPGNNHPTSTFCRYISIVCSKLVYQSRITDCPNPRKELIGNILKIESSHIKKQSKKKSSTANHHLICEVGRWLTHAGDAIPDPA